MKLTCAECTVKTPDVGQRRCPKHVEFYDRINLDNWCVCSVNKKKSITTFGNMTVKFHPLPHKKCVTGMQINLKFFVP